MEINQIKAKSGAMWYIAKKDVWSPTIWFKNKEDRDYYVSGGQIETSPGRDKENVWFVKRSDSIIRDHSISTQGVTTKKIPAVNSMSVTQNETRTNIREPNGKSYAGNMGSSNIQAKMVSNVVPASKPILEKSNVKRRLAAIYEELGNILSSID